ncbi:MAG: LPS export ABC transporter permease LptG [Magnetococcales bacterium]|nr:LPS export ABC transporter permease LptG [Magnetococcales bacterium]
MPILFQYLMKLFLNGFARIVGIFIALFLLVDGIESIRRFSQKSGFNAMDITLMILSRIPEFIGMLFPSMALLTTLLVMSRLARQHEITVMRASGLSHVQILIPFIMGGMVIAFLHLLLLDQITPHTNRIAMKLQDRIVDRHVAPASQAGDLWVRSGRQIIHAQRSDPLNETLHEVIIFTFDDQHRMISRLESRVAVLGETCWQLKDGLDYQFFPKAKVTPFQTRSWDFTLDTGRLTGDLPSPQQLSLNDLRGTVEKMEQDGRNATRYRVIMHRKLAAPCTSLAAILLAFPFALRQPRSGGTMRSILFGLLLGFFMFVVVDLATALGMGGRLPALLAAWAPLILFSAIAGFFLAHQSVPARRR